jgi:hypothetical protein
MTRLLSGASMEDLSSLQEHTLVMAGESVEQCTVWQVARAARAFIAITA